MKPGYGKQKGGSFEREICKKLSLWISNNERDDLYWRSAMSGGRASVQFKKGKINKTQLGDISSIDSEGEILTNNWVVECKSYKNLHVDSLIFGKPIKDSIYGYWNTLYNLCVQTNKRPLLIAKQNGKPTLMLIDFELAQGFTMIYLENINNSPIYIYFFDEVVQDMKFKNFFERILVFGNENTFNL
jgi:hypothetical protein